MVKNIACDVASVLKSCKIENFFMLTGGDQALWIALREHGIRMVVGHSEPSAVYMADGFARASGCPAVTYGQAGPGAANVAAALADAFWAQSPVMALTGSTASAVRHVNEYQALEQHIMFGPVTRWNGSAAHPAQVAALARQALQMTMAGTPGPTHLDIPKDYFALPSEGMAPEGPPPAAPACAGVDAAQVGVMVEKLLGASRPLLLVGEGVRFAGAWEELAELSTRAGLPMVTTVGGKSAVLAAHPHFMGVVGRYSSRAANDALARADVVLALGTRLGGLATNGYHLPSPKAVLLQVDRDPSAFINPYFPQCCLLAELRPALRAFLENFAQAGPVTPWREECRASRARWLEHVRLATLSTPEKNGLSPLTVLAALEPYGREISLVADTGYMSAWTGVLFPLQRYDSFFRAAGSLGWALPASLGVQMARKEKVVCVTGDGGACYHLSDIETAVRYHLPVVILILNNSCLAFEYHEQKYRWQGQVVEEANNFTQVDYAAVARALGAHGDRVEDGAALRVALGQAMLRDGPTVIEVVTDREAYPPVTNFETVMERVL